MTQTLALIEREDELPVCPHCNLDLTEISVRKRGVPIGQGRTLVFFCPHCKKVLGIGQERAL